MSAIRFETFFQVYDADSPVGEYLITGMEVSHMTRHFSKSNKFNNVNPVGGRTETHHPKMKLTFTMSKSKCSGLS